MLYHLNDEEVSKEFFTSYNLEKPLVKVFKGDSIFGYEYKNLELLFNGKYKSKMEINKHLEKAIKAKETLMKAGIIDEKGEITEQYGVLKSFNNTEQSVTNLCKKGGRECFCDGSCKKQLDNLNLKNVKALSETEGIWDKIVKNQDSQVSYTDTKEFIKERLKLAEDLKKSAFYSMDKAEVTNSDEGKKETEGKVDYSEINLEILDLMAERFTANKHKYPKGNMKKPIDIKSLEWALFRHVKKMIQPIETDEETYKDHLSAVLCNCSMILDQLENVK